MVNKVAKGRRAEREFEKHLQEQGFETWRPAWSKYAAKDIFRIADIIAIDNSQILFVQVKTNASDFYKARQQAREFMKNKTIQDLLLIVALKEKGAIYRVWIIDYMGYEKEYIVNIKTNEEVKKIKE